jgi:hypothetical protein
MRMKNNPDDALSGNAARRPGRNETTNPVYGVNDALRILLSAQLIGKVPRNSRHFQGGYEPALPSDVDAI